MLSLFGAGRIFLYDGPADMRKGFDGLTTLIEAAFPHQRHQGCGSLAEVDRLARHVNHNAGSDHALRTAPIIPAN